MSVAPTGGPARGTIRKSELEAKLIGLVEPVVQDLGYDLRDLEISSQHGMIVRIILDRPLPHDADDAPIGIHDCQKVHQALNPMFDVWDPIPSAYSLEISSPGESPALRRLEHFEQARGQKIKFQTVEPLPMPEPAKPRKNWESTLADVDVSESAIVVEDQFGRHRVALELIKNATWIRDWSIQKREKAPAGRGKRKETR